MTDVLMSEEFYYQCMGAQLIIPDTCLNGNVDCMPLARWPASRHSVDSHMHLFKEIVLFFMLPLEVVYLGSPYI